MNTGRTRFIGVAVAVALAAAIPTSVGAAGNGPTAVKIWEENVIPAADFGLGMPTDISYQPKPARLVIQGKNGSKKALRKTTLLGQRRAGQALPAATLWTTYDPTTSEVLTISRAASRVADDRQVIRIDSSRNRTTPPAGRVIERSLDRFRDVVIAPDGKAYGLLDRDIVLLTQDKGRIDGGTKRVVKIKGRLGANADQIVVAPGGKRFWVLDRESKRLYRLKKDGTPDRVMFLGTVGVVNPRSAVFAPSADPTDARSEHSLYVADGGAWRNGQRVKAGIREITRIAPARQRTGFSTAAEGTVTLIQTIDTSAWNKPSPDPMALAYASTLGKFTLIDSEIVEGHPVFMGVNVWTFGTGGNGVGVDDTSSWDPAEKEPVGAAFDAAGNRYFITNDSKQHVTQVKPGGDGQFWTGDDVRNTFSVAGFAADPEGLAFGQGRLFIADGAAKEIHVLDPGAGGGFFDGYTVSSYDVESVGISDAEGVTYAPDLGSLFVLSRKGNIFVELAPLTGALRTTYRINSINAVSPSGLAYGPGSTGSGNRIWLSARGVDNNADPDENDGKVYELEIDDTPPPPPTVRLVNGGFEQDDDNNGRPDAWTENANFIRSTDGPPTGGDYVGKHFGSNESHKIQQNVDGVIPGTTYRLEGDVWLKTGADRYVYKVRINWRNANNKKVAVETVVQYKNVSTPGWVTFSEDVVPPAGAAIARVMLIVKGLDGEILVDRWSFGLPS